MNQKKSQRKNNLVIQSSILAIASIIVRILGMLYRIPLYRIVGDEGMGFSGFTYEIYLVLLLISSNGIPLAVSLLVSSRLARQEYKGVQRILQGALIFAAIIGGAVSLLTFVGADWLAKAIFSMEEVAPSLKVIAPTVVISAVMGVFRGYFQGKNSMMPTAVSQIIEGILNAVVSVVAAYFLIVKGPAYGAAGSTLGTCIGALGSLIFLVIVYQLYKPTVMRAVKRDRVSKHMPLGSALQLMAVTMIPLILSSSIYQIVGILDSSLYSHILNNLGYNSKTISSMFGVYSGQYKQLINVPLGITAAIGVALIPSITAANTLEHKNEVHSKINEIIRLTMIIAIPCFVGLAILSGSIMQMIFNPSTGLSGELLMLGSITVVTYSFSTVTNSVLQGLNKLKVPIINSGIALVIHTVFVVFLLYFSDLNIYALIFGNLIFSFVVCVLNVISLYKFFQYKLEIVKTFLIPGAASAIMGAIIFFVYKVLYYLIGSNAAATIFSIVLGIIVYAVAIIAFGGIEEEELYNLPKGYLLVRFYRKIRFM